MKKILFSLLLIISPAVGSTSWYDDESYDTDCYNASYNTCYKDCCDECALFNSCFLLALTSGYVFKHHDTFFKEVYGRGIINIITIDGCYFPWESWGIGGKVSYWRTKGKTNVLKQRTSLHEEPLTFYVRKTTNWWCNIQPYISLGGGVIFIQEKSYLGHVHKSKGIGELEVGLNYPVWCFLNITGAFRYLFPREVICQQKSDIGGFDLRAGISFSF